MIETNTVHCMDALELLRALPDASVDLICTDPPYNGVKDEAWDNQWATDADYIAWIGQLCEQWRRVLKPNGSLYVFASPRMAARVEVEIGRWFNVLNQLVWSKPWSRHSQSDPEVLRGFFPQTERIIFAEQFGAEPDSPDAFSAFIRAARERAGLKSTDVDVALGYVRKKDPTKGTELCRRWEDGTCIPSERDFNRVLAVCNAEGSYQSLLSEHRRMQLIFDQRRRAFNLTYFTPYTDVWSIAPVQTHPGKHPCEKPLALLEHMIAASTRPGDLVLDTFAGSGATLDAARRLGRRYLGGNMNPHWVAYSERRLSHGYTLPMLFADAESEGA